MPDILEDSTLVPDLAVVCSMCKSLIVLHDLKDHRELHDALRVFNLTELPATVQSLSDRRKFLIKVAFVKYMKNHAIEFEPRQWEERITKINQAFELVKSYLNGTFENNRQLKAASLKFRVRGELFLFKFCFFKLRSFLKHMLVQVKAELLATSQ
jgi:hypothetical protein